jgi:ABC-type amino acid transport substrate-binding protein
MKKLTALLISVILLISTACSPAEESAVPRTHADFEGKKIGVIKDTLCYFTSETIGAVPVNYSDSAAAVKDVKNGTIDGYMNAYSAVRVMAAELGDDFEAIAVPLDIFKAEIGGISLDGELIRSFNEMLAELTENGLLDRQKNIWFSDNFDIDYDIVGGAHRGSHDNGVLKVATTSDAKPYAYLHGGEWMGFSVELAQYFGAHLGMLVEFVDVEFGELIPTIVDGKADFGIANMVITEERAELVIFTDPLCNEQHGILAKK